MSHASAAPLVAGVVALLGVLVWIVPAASAARARTDNASATQLFSDIEAVRATHGLHRLVASGELTAKAQGWADTMVGAGRIFHSHVQTGVSSKWALLGENVGRGPTVALINAAFIASPEHYRNLVEPSYALLGVGAASDGAGVLYLAEEFEAIAGSGATPPKPATVPGISRPTGPLAFVSSQPAPTARASVPASDGPGSGPPAPRIAAVPVELRPLPRIAGVLAQLRTFDHIVFRRKR